ncbi:MAG: D-alanine--D-alanine ligase [Pseudomonadota bacterium]
MRIGIAFDLKEDFDVPPQRDDLLEEYDSIETVHAIARELERLGHGVELLHGGRRFLRNVTDRPVDLVFNIAEGRGGRSREAQIPALCELLEIPCTHSDALALALSLDKGLSVQVAKAGGVPTPLQHIVKAPGEEMAAGFPLPVVLKPLHEGSSMGVRNDGLITDCEVLPLRVRELLERYRQPVIVEEFLPGRELTVGIVGNSPPRIMGIMEIAPRDRPIGEFLYSIETKRNYLELVDYHCPPTGLSERTLVETGRLALKVYDIFGCQDVARVDFRLDAQGGPRFLEINPLPGLSPTYSDLCIMASLINLPYATLIENIVNAAIERHWGENPESEKKRQAPAASARSNHGRLQ